MPYSLGQDHGRHRDGVGEVVADASVVNHKLKKTSRCAQGQYLDACLLKYMIFRIHYLCRFGTNTFSIKSIQSNTVGLKYDATNKG